MTGRGGITAAGWVGRAVILALAAVIALGWWGLHEWGKAMHPTPPDVAAMANAAPAREADHAATDLTDSQLSQLHTQTSWADQLGTSVVDRCSTRLSSASVAAFPHWEPVSCERTVTAYLAFDGDLDQRLQELDRAIGALGWTSGYGRGLAEQSRMMHSGDVDVPYSKAGPPQAALNVAVRQAPADPSNPGSWDDWSSPYATNGKPGPDNASHRTVNLTWQPVNAAQLARSTSRHYVVAFRLNSGYWAEPSAHSPGPSCPSTCHQGALGS